MSLQHHKENQRWRGNIKENGSDVIVNDDRFIDFTKFSKINMKKLFDNNDIDILQQNLDNIVFGEFSSQNLSSNVRRHNDDSIKSFRICQRALKEMIRNQENMITDLNSATMKYSQKRL